MPNTASGVASSFPHNRRAIIVRFDGSDTGYEPKLLPLRYSAEWSQAGERTHGAAELRPGGRAQGAAELPPGGRAQGAAELHWPSASIECASAAGSRAWLGLRGVSGSLLVTRSYAGGRGALPSCFRVRAAAAEPTTVRGVLRQQWRHSLPTVRVAVWQRCELPLGGRAPGGDVVRLL